MRSFLMFYVSDFECDDDRSPVILGKSRSAERAAFTLLCSVCWSWHQTLMLKSVKIWFKLGIQWLSEKTVHQTLTGWTESPTSRWVRHQLKKLIEREYTHLTPARYF